jgi:hypothetical protein
VAENVDNVELAGEAAPNPLKPPKTKVISNTKISKPTAINIIVLIGKPCALLSNDIFIY